MVILCLGFPGQDSVLTEAAVLLVQFSVLLLPGAAAKEPAEEDVEVAEDDKRRGQDGPVVEGHDQLIALKLPHLVGNGLDLEEGVAVQCTPMSRTTARSVIIVMTRLKYNTYTHRY